MSEERAEGFLGGFLFGALIGLTLGILYAPRPGEETRKLVKDKGIEITEKVKEKGEEIKETFESKAQEIKEKGKEFLKKKDLEIQEEDSK